MKPFVCHTLVLWDSIVVWDRADYLREAEKQLLDKKVYQEVQFKKQMLSNLIDTSNNFFRGLKTKGFIAEKELKYFTYEYKKACNLAKITFRCP